MFKERVEKAGKALNS